MFSDAQKEPSGSGSDASVAKSLTFGQHNTKRKKAAL
jgi:hypothetical protein